MNTNKLKQKVLEYWNKQDKKRVFHVTLAVLAVLLSLVLFLKSKTADYSKIFPEAQKISQDIRKHFQNKADYRGLNTEYAVKNEIVAKELVRKNKIFSYYQSEILIGRDIDGNTLLPTDQAYIIVYNNLDKNKCVALVSFPFSSTSGLVSMIIKNEDVFEFSYGEKLGLPVSEEQARKYCKQKNVVALSFE